MPFFSPRAKTFHLAQSEKKKNEVNTLGCFVVHKRVEVGSANASGTQVLTLRGVINKKRKNISTYAFNKHIGIKKCSQKEREKEKKKKKQVLRNALVSVHFASVLGGKRECILENRVYFFYFIF